MRRLKERNTCACKYHVEMVELRHGFNNMRTGSKGVHGRNCTCGCDICCSNTPGECLADRVQFSGLTDMWSSILCPVEDSIWYNPSCLKGNCEMCGIDMLITCPLEEGINSTRLMQWKCYEKVIHGKTRAGKDNKVLRLQYKETTAKVFLEYMRPKFRKFIVHNYFARFQDEQYHICLETFPQDSILSAIDFAENYTLQEYNEVQEMHWHSFQITILVHITYRWNPNFIANPNFGEKKLLTEYHYYISDDTEHDTLFVQHCFELHWSHLVSRGIQPNEHLVWSDGCAGQFKSRRAWYHVARYVSISTFTVLVVTVYFDSFLYLIYYGHLIFVALHHLLIHLLC